MRNERDAVGIVHKKEQILGVSVDVITSEEIIEEARKAIKDRYKYSIMAINPKKIMLAQKNEKLKKALDKASCAIPDGHYVVNQIESLKERVTGIDLMQEICDKHKLLNAKIFLYGSSKEILLNTRKVLQEKYKNIRIVGMADGYSECDVIEKINHSKANVVFVALGSPKQELWIDDNIDKIKANVILGVGGSFDVVSGQVSRAPKFMQQMGLEWLYRFIHEPRRMKEILIYIKYLFLVKRSKKKL